MFAECTNVITVLFWRGKSRGVKFFTIESTGLGLLLGLQDSFVMLFYTNAPGSSSPHNKHMKTLPSHSIPYYLHHSDQGSTGFVKSLSFPESHRIYVSYPMITKGCKFTRSGQKSCPSYYITVHIQPCIDETWWAGSQDSFVWTVRCDRRVFLLCCSKLVGGGDV